MANGSEAERLVTFINLIQHDLNTYGLDILATTLRDSAIHVQPDNPLSRSFCLCR